MGGGQKWETPAGPRGRPPDIKVKGWRDPGWDWGVGGVGGDTRVKEKERERESRC